jgi:hypothetical protein
VLVSPVSGAKDRLGLSGKTLLRKFDTCGSRDLIQRASVGGGEWSRLREPRGAVTFKAGRPENTVQSRSRATFPNRA